MSSASVTESTLKYPWTSPDPYWMWKSDPSAVYDEDFFVVVLVLAAVDEPVPAVLAVDLGDPEVRRARVEYDRELLGRRTNLEGAEVLRVAVVLDDDVLGLSAGEELRVSDLLGVAPEGRRDCGLDLWVGLGFERKLECLVLGLQVLCHDLVIRHLRQLHSN